MTSTWKNFELTALWAGRGLLSAALLLALGNVASADNAESFDRGEHFRHERFFFPDNLIVTRSVYDNNPKNVIVGTVLPPNCAATTGGCSAASGAPNDGSYPNVWNNDIYDASFGITSKIFLDQMTPFGWPVNTLEVPANPGKGGANLADHLVTSFSSKSELRGVSFTPGTDL
jgi:hypothetical protein